jgi:hypothetical protein
MSEIDDVAEVENQGKTERHQHIERADDEPVGDIKQEKLRHKSPDEKTQRQPGKTLLPGS